MTKQRFVGRQAELGALCEALRDGESVVLIGGRRAGKTWLVHKITEALIDRPVFFTSGDQLSFCDERNALRKLAKTVGLSWDPSWDEFYGREGFVDHVTMLGPIALVIDETDRLLNYEWAGRFLAWLRGLIETSALGRTLSVVAVGGPVLNDYCNPDDRGSPVLNLARRLYLEPLDDEALRELLLDHPAKVEVDEIIEAAGGQPLLAQMYLRGRARDNDHAAAVRWMIEECRHHLSVWREQLGAHGLRFLANLGAEGLALDAVRGSLACSRARYLCLVRVREGIVMPGPAAVLREIAGATRARYDIALAYPSEDNEVARSAYQWLVGREISVFYAELEKDWLTGPDPCRAMPNLFGQQAETVLLLCTDTYRAKYWSLAEYRNAKVSCERVVLWALDGQVPEDWPNGEISVHGSVHEILVQLLGPSAMPESGESADLIALRHISAQLAQFAEEILGALERIEDTTKTFSGLSEDDIIAFRQLGELAAEYLQVRILDDQRQATLTVGQKATKAFYEDKVPKWLRFVVDDLQRARSSGDSGADEP